MLPRFVTRPGWAMSRLRYRWPGRASVVVALALASAGCGSAFAGSPETCPTDAPPAFLETSQGRVAVERQVGEPWEPRLISVNGKTVYTSDDDPYLSLCSVYAIDRGVAVLFRSNPGGLNIDHYHFLLLGRSARPTVVTAKDFYSPTSQIEVEVRKDALRVDLGYEFQAHKTAMLRHARLTVRSEKPVGGVPLKAAVCTGLQDLLAQCADRGPRHLGCEAFAGENYEMGLSAGAMLWITGLKQHPGFASTSFGEACRRACENPETPAPSTFSQTVCNRVR